MDKKSAQEVHFARRLYERYGIHITPDLKTYLMDVVQYDPCHPTIKKSKRVTIHQVFVEIDSNIHSLLVVYDKTRKTLVTVLPKTDKRHAISG
jgi:hypothetical protein